MSEVPAMRHRILPAIAAVGVVAVLAGGAWYGYRVLGARPIAQVAFGGDIARIPPAELEAFARSLRGASAGSVTLASVREAARRIPWVRDAAVRRRFPDGIEVTFQAYEPLARWAGHGLVSREGDVFDASFDGKLPLFQGPQGSAPVMAQQYRALAPLLAPLASPVAELRLSARGGWQVRLDSGLSLDLGRGDVAPRIERFVAAWPGLARRGVETRHADLRYANGFALRTAANQAVAKPASPNRHPPKNK